jgi:hypothetical protein
MTELRAPVRYETKECRLAISRLARGRVLVVLEGRDLGELGDEPFVELEKDFAQWSAVELFIDARAAVSAAIEVSGSWAVWLAANEARLRHVSMLTGSPFIQLSANVVKRFSELGEKMRIYTEAAAFEAALAAPA